MIDKIPQAFAINSDWTVSDALSINTIFTTNRSDAEYGFDEDWTGPELQPEYQAFDNYSSRYCKRLC
jgi:hypothetical protein